MTQQVSGSLGIELSAEGAVRDANLLKGALHQVVSAEDLVVAASKAVTQAWREEAAEARRVANEARAQENARREAADAKRDSARLASRAAAEEAQAAKAVARELAQKARAEETTAKETAKAAAAEKRATEALNTRARAMAAAESEAHKMNTALDKQTQSANGLSGAFGKLGVAAAAYKALQYAREGLDLVDTYTNMRSRLGLVTDGVTELNDVQGKLLKVSQETRSELNTNVALYTTLYRATRQLGTSQEAVIGLTKTINQSFLVSGASADVQANAVRQLSQALASGVLRGDEFNSIAENAPRLQQAVAASLGISIGKLREYAAEGKITADVVVKALQQSADSIDREAQRMAATIGGSVTQIKNSLLVAIGEFERGSGAVAGLAKSLGDYSKAVDASNGDTVSAAKEFGFFAAAVTASVKAVAALVNGPKPDEKETETIKRVTKAYHDAKDAVNAYLDARKGIVAKAVELAPVTYQNVTPFGASARGGGTVTDDQKKLAEQYAKTTAAAQLELDKQRELTAAYGQSARAIEDINDRYSLKAKLATIDKDLSTAQKAALTELIVSTHAQAMALKQMQRAQEDANAAWDEGLKRIKLWVAEANEAKAEQKESTRLTDKATESFQRVGRAIVDAAHKSSNIRYIGEELRAQEEAVKDLGDAIKDDLLGALESFARSGKLTFESFFRSVEGMAGSMVNRLSAGIKKLQDDIGNEIADEGTKASLAKLQKQQGALIGVGAIANGYQSGSVGAGVASGLIGGFATGGPVGAFVGGLGGLIGGMLGAAKAADENRAANKALKEAYDLTIASIERLASGLSTTLTDAIDGVRAQFISLRQQLGTRTNLSKDFGGDRLRADYDKELTRLNDLEAKRVQQLIDEQKAIEANFKIGNEVLVLRVAGLDEEATAMERAQAIEVERLQNIKNGIDITEANKRAMLQTQLVEKQLAEQRAAEAKRLDRSLFDINNATKAFTDPRGASDAAFAEAQRRRYDDASTAAEKAAVALYNLAEATDRAAQLALRDATDNANFTSRILAARGDDRQAQDIARKAANANEYDQAFRNGTSTENLALLLKAQFAEGSQMDMQRAIEDGTKAINAQRDEQLKAADETIKNIQTAAAKEEKGFNDAIDSARKNAEQAAKQFDAQIDATRDGVKAQLQALDVQLEAARVAQQYAQEQVQLAQQQLDTTKRVVEGLQSFEDSLKLGNLSTLSPTDKLAEARKQRDELAQRAYAGDKEAALKVTDAIRATLEQSQLVNASGVGFVGDSVAGQAIIDKLQGQYGSQLLKEQGALSGAQNAAATQAALIAGLEAQKESLSAAAEKQIESIEALKKEAGINAEKEIQTLTDFKDAAAAGYADELKAAQEARDAINTFHDAAIQKLIDLETAANQDRIDRYAIPQPVVFQPVQTMTPDGVAVRDAVNAQNQVLTGQLAELRNTVAELRAMVAQSANNATRGDADAIVDAINESADTIRRSVSRATVNT